MDGDEKMMEEISGCEGQQQNKPHGAKTQWEDKREKMSQALTDLW
jgi:hypothetical protein